MHGTTRRFAIFLSLDLKSCQTFRQDGRFTEIDLILIAEGISRGKKSFL